MDLTKISLEFLAIETTRRCNMACSHCYVGEAQDVDLDTGAIDALLNQVNAFGEIFFTGGEPLLNLTAISHILYGLSKRGIPVFKIGLISNGSIYDERLVDLLKKAHQIVEITHRYASRQTYDPLRVQSVVHLGISLDQYHEQHEKCYENYERYKRALDGYADVKQIMHGNSVNRMGRAEQLDIPMINIESTAGIYHKQRVEMLDAIRYPCCKHYSDYKLVSPDQRLVCCPLLLNADGSITIVQCMNYSYNKRANFPKICTADEKIWEKILEYNTYRQPCVVLEDAIADEIKRTNRFEDVVKLRLANFDAVDEPSIYTKQVEASATASAKKHLSSEYLNRLAHPTDAAEAIGNVIHCLRDYVSAMDKLRIEREKIDKEKEIEQMSPGGLIYAASKNAYYPGDPRGNVTKEPA